MGDPESWDQEWLRLELRMHARRAREGRLGQLSCIYILIWKRLCHHRSPPVLPRHPHVPSQGLGGPLFLAT